MIPICGFFWRAKGYQHLGQIKAPELILGGSAFSLAKS